MDGNYRIIEVVWLGGSKSDLTVYARGNGPRLERRK
jgi:hypothetical protein